MSKTLLFTPDTFDFTEVTRCMDVARRLPGVWCVFADIRNVSRPRSRKQGSSTGLWLLK